jgi:hypothetical protein
MVSPIPIVSVDAGLESSHPDVSASGAGDPMTMLGHVLSLRRQIMQARLDATQMLYAARSHADQRRVDHFSGKALAYQTIIDMIDIEFQSDTDDSHASNRRLRDRDGPTSFLSRPGSVAT